MTGAGVGQGTVGAPQGLIQSWGWEAIAEMGLEGATGISWQRDLEDPGPQHESWFYVLQNCWLRCGVQHEGSVTKMMLEELMEPNPGLRKHVKHLKSSQKVVGHYCKVLRGSNVYVCLLEREL